MSEDDEEDPFAMFGGSDEDKQDNDDADTNAKRARELLAQANQQQGNSTTAAANTAVPLDDVSANQVPSASGTLPAVETLAIHSDVSLLNPFELPWEKPLYTERSIQLVSSLPVGGGRGYVATQTLPAGTLVLLEEPILAWPEGEAFSVDLERIQVILMSDKANQVVAAMEHFHPTRTLVNNTWGTTASDNPSQVEEMIQHCREAIQSDDLRLKTVLQVAAAKGVTNADASAITELDVLRMLVELRYNSLETGIYLHVAMLNHADFPNCVKFRPTQQGKYSEVRTTRTVQAGEALTISYVPRPLCHASRRQHLWDQHRFESGTLREDSPVATWELINGKLPSSAADVELMQNIETATAELEDQCRGLVMSASNQPMAEDQAETAKALELAALELYTSASNQLKNENHCLLIPCLTLHLDACDLVQRHVQLPKNQRAMLLARLVSTGRKLIALQKRILGPDHFDLARTHLDVAHGIQGENYLDSKEPFQFFNRFLVAQPFPFLDSSELLSEAPKALFDSDRGAPATVHFWSTAESEARKEHNRIKNLYPHDAEKHIRPPS